MRYLFYFASSIVLFVLLGSAAVYFLESGQNPHFASFGNALWFAVVAATTVGYGDIVPITFWGRLVATILAFGGIAIFGGAAALVAKFFLERMLAEGESGKITLNVGRNRELEEALKGLKKLSKLSNEELKELENKFDRIIRGRIRGC